MSASGRMAKKVEVRRKWEDALKAGGYEEPTIYARSVLTWQRPIDFGVLLVAVAAAFWFYTSIETPVITLVSLAIVGWVVLSWLLNATAFKLPWHHVLVKFPNAQAQEEYFGQIVAFFVEVRFALSDAVEEMQRFRAANPNRFTIQIAVCGLLLAYIGSFMSGMTLVILATYALMLLPGALANGVPAHVAAVVEPHIKVYREKATELLGGVMKKVDQQMQKGKVAAQHVAADAKVVAAEAKAAAHHVAEEVAHAVHPEEVESNKKDD